MFCSISESKLEALTGHIFFSFYILTLSQYKCHHFIVVEGVWKDILKQIIKYHDFPGTDILLKYNPMKVKLCIEHYVMLTILRSP